MIMYSVRFVTAITVVIAAGNGSEWSAVADFSFGARARCTPTPGQGLVRTETGVEVVFVDCLRMRART